MLEQKTVMLGAVCGDVAGSLYEFHNIWRVLDEDGLVNPQARFTDDSVMTLAVADGISRALDQLETDWMKQKGAYEVLFREIRNSLQFFGRKYPHAGYGGSFRRWIHSTDPQPYNSWGNGSAMRCSFAGWAANSLAEAEELAAVSAAVTHNHPEGIKGAKVVAGIIWMLRAGKSKDEVRAYAKQFYPLDFTLDEIRDSYYFDVSCQGSVPQSIMAFLEGESYTEVIARGISIGGDSDTIAAIAGSMAEVIYPIPQRLRDQTVHALDPFLENVWRNAGQWLRARNSAR